MTKQYIIESDAVAGTNADSWADFAELLSAWVGEAGNLDEDELAEQGAAFAARAVMLAGGTSRKVEA